MLYVNFSILSLFLIYLGQGQAIFEDEFLKIERNRLQAICTRFLNKMFMNTVLISTYIFRTKTIITVSYLSGYMR